MSRKLLTLLAGITLLVALFAATGATFAARTSTPVGAASTPSLNFPEMQKQCAVLNVYLNGTPHPGISCAHRQLPAKQVGVKPYTTSGSCNGSETMFIDYNSGGAQICFYGTGYLAGFGTLSKVIEVDVYISSGWFREYNPTGGHYCTLAYADLLIYESVSITQVNPGATDTGVCG